MGRLWILKLKKDFGVFGLGILWFDWVRWRQKKRVERWVGEW